MAERILIAETATHVISGEVTIKNPGLAPTKNLSLVAELFHWDGDEYVSLGDPVSVDISSHPVLNPDESETYAFSLTVTGGPYTKLKAVVQATADNVVETYEFSIEFDISDPDPSEDESTDRTVSVLDEFIDPPEGFDIEVAVVREWQAIEGPDWTITYSVTIENVGADQGAYEFNNTATLTKDDSEEEISSSALVIVSVQSEQIITDPTTLEASVTQEISWGGDLEYDWDISKTVSPEELTVKINPISSGIIGYSLLATRSFAVNNATYDISGVVGIKNSGDAATVDLYATVELFGWNGEEYVSLEGPVYVDLSSKPELEPGESDTYAYTFTYTGDYYSRFKVEAIAGAANVEVSAQDVSEEDTGDPM